MATPSIQSFRKICLSSFNLKNCRTLLGPSSLIHSRNVSNHIPATVTNKELRETIKQVPDDFRHVYPDFLPPAKYTVRSPLREKLEREDMLARRTTLDVPEFYVGSIMRVRVSDTNATGKVNEFTGICIDRFNFGIRSYFTLRNVVDHIGVEIRYDIYCPLLLSIVTVRLEKRLDPHLLFLRDCLPEFSTFPLDMAIEPIADGVPVPINKVKAVLKPRPWHIKWNLRDIEGIAERPVKLREIAAYHRIRKPWEKYDLMLDYREGITIEEQAKVFNEIRPHFDRLEEVRRKVRRS